MQLCIILSNSYQHYMVSTPLKLNTFCASHSILLTLNHIGFNNNELNTTLIQHHFNSTTLHLKKNLQKSHIQHHSHSTISLSTPLTFNNPCFQQCWFSTRLGFKKKISTCKKKKKKFYKMSFFSFFF